MNEKYVTNDSQSDRVERILKERDDLETSAEVLNEALSQLEESDEDNDDGPYGGSRYPRGYQGGEGR